MLLAVTSVLVAAPDASLVRMLKAEALHTCGSHTEMVRIENPPSPLPLLARGELPNLFSCHG